jgi:SAM-dependent methyltransferase
VLEKCAMLAPGALILDLACGRGRHAVPLARSGRTVVALDVVEMAVRVAAAGSPLVRPVVATAAALPFRVGVFDAIVVVSFLDRALFPGLVRLLATGGTLIYETYTEEHRCLTAGGRTRGPSDRRYLLERGELVRLVAPLAIIDQREGLVVDDAGERFVASVVARAGR